MASVLPNLYLRSVESQFRSLRPTFKWYGLQGWPDYQVQCATTSDEASLIWQLGQVQCYISDVSAAKPACDFTINEYSMGLDESTPSSPFWYWRVTTVNTTDATTSEVGSFRIVLPKDISSVINYPNPFNPKIEKTKIRYRLGAAPDSVTIRIYDIAGRLVRELDGTCNPEGSNILDKYNDVEWDGCNGRGDMVLNGVYPYEITVSYGNRSIRGRGKAVVLK